MFTAKQLVAAQVCPSPTISTLNSNDHTDTLRLARKRSIGGKVIEITSAIPSRSCRNRCTAEGIRLVPEAEQGFHRSSGDGCFSGLVGARVQMERIRRGWCCTPAL